MFVEQVAKCRGILMLRQVGEIIARRGVGKAQLLSSYREMHIPAGGAAGSTSGHGRMGGRHTLREMSDLKSITFHIGDGS